MVNVMDVTWLSELSGLPYKEQGANLRSWLNSAAKQIIVRLADISSQLHIIQIKTLILI